MEWSKIPEITFSKHWPVNYTILGFGGPIGVGKDTAADLAVLLTRVGTPFIPIRINFADEVKKIAREQFGWDGVKDDKGRRLLQAIGHAGREYDIDIWVKKIQAFCDTLSGPYPYLIICSDARYRNETQWLQERGLSVRLVGPSRGDYSLGDISHSSETSYDDCFWSLKMQNTSTIEDLEAVVAGIVHRLYDATAIQTHFFSREGEDPSRNPKRSS